MIKPIETTWRGFRFRSRTEARWAVALTLAGIEFSYEPEGYNLPSGPYLPDFWLPKSGWLEIKGQEPTEHEITLCRELSAHTKRAAHIAVGPPDFDRPLICIFGNESVGEADYRNIFGTDNPRVDKAFERAKAERFDGRSAGPGARGEPKPMKWW